MASAPSRASSPTAARGLPVAGAVVQKVGGYNMRHHRCQRLLQHDHAHRCGRVDMTKFGYNEGTLSVTDSRRRHRQRRLGPGLLPCPPVQRLSSTVPTATSSRAPSCRGRTRRWIRPSTDENGLLLHRPAFGRGRDLRHVRPASTAWAPRPRPSRLLADMTLDFNLPELDRR